MYSQCRFPSHVVVSVGFPPSKDFNQGACNMSNREYNHAHVQAHNLESVFATVGSQYIACLHPLSQHLVSHTMLMLCCIWKVRSKLHYRSRLSSCNPKFLQLGQQTWFTQLQTPYICIQGSVSVCLQPHLSSLQSKKVTWTFQARFTKVKISKSEWCKYVKMSNLTNIDYLCWG